MFIAQLLLRQLTVKANNICTRKIISIVSYFLLANLITSTFVDNDIARLPRS